MRWRLIERHPWQWVNGILTSTSGVAVGLWFGLAFALRSETLERFPFAVQVTDVALALAIGSFCAWGLVTAKSRKSWLKFLEPVTLTHGVYGVPALVLAIVWIVAFATLGFAGVSELLYLHGIATTEPDRALADPLTDSGRFYLWSFLNAIPVLEIPQALGWKLAFRFTDHVSPVLLLLYKVTVIGPVIATARLRLERTSCRQTRSAQTRVAVDLHERSGVLAPEDADTIREVAERLRGGRRMPRVGGILASTSPKTPRSDS